MASKKKPKNPFEIKEWLTTKDLCRMMQRTIMMIYLYRQGMPTMDPLPYYTQQNGNRHRVFFKTREVVAWADKHGIEIDLTGIVS